MGKELALKILLDGIDRGTKQIRMSNKNKGNTTHKLGLVIVGAILVSMISISMPAKVVGPSSFVIGVLFSIIWDNLFFAKQESK